ncbi:BZ3500_MvSof-1268-A1-R1_Chr10-2g02881 [Microbotryum saponariae]|uniref:BZ3500_MvSof-1268-A1-R1_Chr10-2g02881 protein n=1 Tax=Microbotryum saponariae TaxID=289078 RepID=A0A2X0LYI1_9BASI|nr:BZ3501_MvSof-1269-A2-R1_Chr10-2g02467 [Microbotryum saponariae]SDA01665.1 BZ3500_MvSof-1268-A1-R1_Chr10-2g02881 [Microbotryum saponariae]
MAGRSIAEKDRSPGWSCSCEDVAELGGPWWDLDAAGECAGMPGITSETSEDACECLRAWRDLDSWAPSLASSLGSPAVSCVTVIRYLSIPELEGQGSGVHDAITGLRYRVDVHRAVAALRCDELVSRVPCDALHKSGVFGNLVQQISLGHVEEIDCVIDASHRNVGAIRGEA